MVWAASSTFRVGDYHLGVRSSSFELDALLRRALAAHVVDDDAAPANYSLRIGDAPSGSGVPLHFLFEGHQTAVRARSPGRVLEALARHLSAYAEPVADGRLRVRAVAFVDGDVAVLAPARLRSRLLDLEPALSRDGLRLLDAPWASLDARTGQLVVDPPGLSVDPVAWDDIGALAPAPRRPEAPLPAGRYRISGWLFARPGDDGTALSRGAALMEAVPGVANADLPPQRLLDGLAAALAAARAETVEADRPKVIRQLVRLASG